MSKKKKIPKTIAGVKVPKELRKASKKLAKLAEEPVARDIALGALAAGLAARKDVQEAAKKAAAKTGVDVPEDSKWVSAALGAAAMEAGRRIVKVIEASDGKGGSLAAVIRTAGSLAGKRS